ncbi:50S ribosomal protein L7/L12 [Clostridium sp. YIM B02515]|uniref:50S ribosomal protein L7/L12 n=1 Tax=Clostridium rhizosphaerae TaxID=2803861 RepID=A0ABS1TE97_9CLOT|nr:ribosomal protein L7/L12 [Clostridium rhizosphaerae]MBL4937695.1 50S ribosomal protein L7/L12 [Clostridium rhizosphaerae]
MDINLVWIIIGGVVLISISSSISQLRSDLARINANLDRIAKQIGVPDLITDELDIELKQLILEGKKIEAIKKYRIATGIGLKEAKEHIDRLSLK